MKIVLVSVADPSHVLRQEEVIYTVNRKKGSRLGGSTLA
jgi:hypothetical protein